MHRQLCEDISLDFGKTCIETDMFAYNTWTPAVYQTAMIAVELEGKQCL